MDQAFVIFAMEDPSPNFLLLDRFLIMMDQAGIPSVICFNKKDLAEEEKVQPLAKIYRECGYKVILSSAKEGEGIEEIRNVLKGKMTVVAGPSGVGKSSLTNLLQSQVKMETGEISRKLKRGRHTTRHSQVIPAGGKHISHGYPRILLLCISQIWSRAELKDYFPEFRKFEDGCRFQGCVHNP